MPRKLAMNPNVSCCKVGVTHNIMMQHANVDFRKLGPRKDTN